MERIKKLLENVEPGYGYFVSDESNVKYLSGFMGEAAYLVVSHEGTVLMTDGRYDEQARNECFEEVEVCKWFNPTRPDPETVYHYVHKYKVQNLMFNDSNLSVRIFNNLDKYFQSKDDSIKMWPVSGDIEKLRMVKDDHEINCLKKACAIADQALHNLLPDIKAGVSELELVGKLEYHMKSLGAENISFDTIILSGKKTSYPHGKPSDKALEVGDFLQVDFGALYKGYHSDMSRTFIIGQASDKQVAFYDMMLKATVDSIDALKPGISCKIPDDVVRSVIDADHLEYYYPGLGHGVGLYVHEGPNLRNNSQDVLAKNHVVTVEPGVYIPGWGGMRIEDTVLITQDGYEVLSKFPRKLMVL